MDELEEIEQINGGAYLTNHRPGKSFDRHEDSFYKASYEEREQFN